MSRRIRKPLARRRRAAGRGSSRSRASPRRAARPRRDDELVGVRDRAEPLLPGEPPGVAVRYRLDAVRARRPTRPGSRSETGRRGGRWRTRARAAAAGSGRAAPPTPPGGARGSAPPCRRRGTSGRPRPHARAGRASPPAPTRSRWRGSRRPRRRCRRGGTRVELDPRAGVDLRPVRLELGHLRLDLRATVAPKARTRSSASESRRARTAPSSEARRLLVAPALERRLALVHISMLRRDRVVPWSCATARRRPPSAPRCASGSRRTRPTRTGARGAASMYEAGYAGLTWPKEYGGHGAPYTHQAIVLEEFARAEAPPHIGVIGLGMAGPTIMAHGDEEQKRRYLPKILSAEEIWCQGFSEPGAGSDLSAVRTSVEVERRRLRRQRPEGLVVLRAHRRLLHPRRPQRPGLGTPRRPHVRDRRHEGAGRRGAAAAQITGEAEFNEIFFSDVEVPRENLLGDIGGGWQVAMTTLLHERGTLGFALDGVLEAQVRKLVALAKEQRRRRSDHPRPRRAGVDRAAGAEADQLALADDADPDRHPRPRGLRLEAALVGAEPAADEARDGDPRGRGRRLLAATSSCARAGTRSRPGPARSSATSSPSACSASRGAASAIRVHRRAGAAAPRGARRALERRLAPRGAGRRGDELPRPGGPVRGGGPRQRRRVALRRVTPA